MQNKRADILPRLSLSVIDKQRGKVSLRPSLTPGSLSETLLASPKTLAPGASVMNVQTRPGVPVPLADDDWPIGVSRPPANLPETDGEPLESNWHRDAMVLLIELIRFLFQGRTDFFVGGNMFIYYSWDQVRNRDYKGPDVFLVKGVDGGRNRPFWAVWQEKGRYPNLIIELLSPTTADVDRTTKKDLYAQTFRTPEYYLYDPETEHLEGWRLNGQLSYQPIVANERGWLWSEQLGVWLGTWRGRFQADYDAVWLRFFTTAGELVPLFAEREAVAAREEKERADKAEADLARLKAFLAEKGLTLPAEDQQPEH
jgi:Uma2 family endonuclease